MEASQELEELYPVADTRCILPWIHQHGDLGGNYSPCCFTLSNEGQFDKGKRPLEAWNSDRMRNIRVQMLTGQEPEECKICYDWEKDGVESHRQRSNKFYSQYHVLFSKTKPDGTLPTPPVYLDFRFGNLCNFKCRMCSSWSSSSWVKEEKFYGKLKPDAPGHVDNWTHNEKFWEDVDKIKNHIQILYFAGGEPFVQEGHYKMLQFLVDNNCAKNITLTYNTNLSYSGLFKGYDIEQLWSHFKKIDLWPSIEGWGDKAEYGRSGLDFKLFTENSHKFTNYINTYSIVSSVYSISSNLQLFKWIKSMNKAFSLTSLYSRPFHSTTIFSSDVKKQLLEEYKKGLFEIKEDLSEYEIKSVLDTLSHMNSRDDSHLAKEFKEYNERLDNYRVESFETTFPELSEWYKSI